MSTLFNEQSKFDLLFRNLFKTDGVFQPTTFENKQPHPIDIYYDDEGLHFEIACTGLTKSDVILDIEGDTLKISYKKPEDEKFHDGTIHQGLSKKSFDIRYKIAARFDLSVVAAEMQNGLLEITIPTADKAKPKSIKIK